jgi:RNA polymerase sigma-70 factor (ECF subfamily)
MTRPELRISPIGGPPEMPFEVELPASDEAPDEAWPQSPDDFQALVEAYLDRLVRYAFRRLGSFPDAEDVVQEVLVRAFRDRRKRRKSLAVGPYLYRCVANACTDLLRKRKRRPRFRAEMEIEEASGGAKDPSEVAMAVEALRRAEELLDCLPEAQAEAIRLRVFDELRLSTIAEIVGCSVNTVCSRLRYGFRKLRQMVSENQG